MTDQETSEPVAGAEEQDVTRQADDRGYIELTANEKQVSVNLQTAINGVNKVGSAILEGRYKSIAITHLETAQMFFNKAIANDGIK